jgi:hypothetical protein
MLNRIEMKARIMALIAFHSHIEPEFNSEKQSGGIQAVLSAPTFG